MKQLFIKIVLLSALLSLVCFNVGAEENKMNFWELNNVKANNIQSVEIRSGTTGQSVILDANYIIPKIQPLLDNGIYEKTTLTGNSGGWSYMALFHLDNQDEPIMYIFPGGVNVNNIRYTASNEQDLKNVLSESFNTYNSNSIISFKDVNSGDKYYSSIQLLKELNIISGYEDGTFRPNNSISRAEFCKILCKVLHDTSSLNGVDEDIVIDKDIFIDIPNNHWAKNYIYDLHAHKIVDGYPNGKFEPELKISYNEIIKMIVCSFEVNKDMTYPDDYISYAQKKGILKDVSVEYSNWATRSTVTAIIANAFYSNKE